MRVLEIEGLGLECQASGRTLPWIGPALRGIVAKTFKDRACGQPWAERETRWRSCRGCPLMTRCAYGQTFEPDPPPGAPVRRGQTDAARPLVLSPQFPLPACLERGDVIPLRAVFIAAAADRADEILQIVDQAVQLKGLHPCGDEPGDAHGGARLPLRLIRQEAERRDSVLTEEDFRGSATAALPELTVELTSPLAVSVANQISLAPRLVDLVAASLRIVSHLFSLYERPLPVDFEGLKQLAERVAAAASDFRPYTQPIMSNRARQKHAFRAVIGSARYTDVPAALLPWLLWGGCLHVGERRVAGAGGWRVRLG